ncbi:MFS transporter [Streptomyces sp. NPDC003038]|uniref:MFS transporter n=1 Tax=unclassified Streptomyces TaxID=2593676 RepID=UPI0033A1D9C1
MSSLAPVAPGPGPPRLHRAGAAAAVCLGLFILGLDLTVLNVAVPDLQSDLAPTTAQVQWTVDAYALVLGGTVLALGAFTDRWGRRRSFLCGLAVCAAASTAGALATTPGQVITARCVMGAGAALLMPATLAVLHHLYPEPALRRRAISAWAAIGGLGGLSGPVVGGWLVEHFSWRAGFWINLPLAAVAMTLALALVPESRSTQRSTFDLPGAALSAGSLLSLVWAVTESPHRGWTSGATLTAFAAAALLLAAFLTRQRRIPHPMLPPALLRRPGVGTGAAALALMSFAMFGALFVLTLYLQGVLGYSPLQAGVRTLPLPGGLAVGAVAAVPLAARLGHKPPIVGGLTVITAGFVVLAGTGPDSAYPRNAVFQLIVGFGAGLVAAAATDLVMGAVPQDRAGLGSAVNDATRQIGSALGVAVQGSVLAAVFTSHLTDSLTRAHAPAHLIGIVGHSGLSAPARAGEVPEAVRPLVVSAAREAFTDAMTVTAFTAGAVTALTAAALFRYLPDRSPRAMPPDREAVGTGHAARSRATGPGR